MARFLALLVLAALALLDGGALIAQDPKQDDKILERGEKLLEEAKAAYEEARTKGSVAAFVDAGFKLEEAKIKFIVLQEIGSPEKQKLATDRLRAINQLGKLVHDGKVAVSGTPAATPPEKPAEPAAAVPETAGKPDPAPVKPSMIVDVTARLVVPPADKQREAEKLIKDLYKEAYAKKSAADRQALARSLIEQAGRTADDPPALWVLYREALDAAAQACDLKLATAAVEAAARVFDIDAMPLKSTAFAAAGKVAKTPAEFVALSEAYLRLVEDWVAADQYDSADKTATVALQWAKRGNDATQVFKATARAKEVAEAKTKYLAMKSVLEVLAKNSEDPSANNDMGQFLCFVKGNWDLGPRFLVKGSDPALKGLAQRELVPPASAAEGASLADGWWELAQQEKSTLRKAQMLAHAWMLYDGAAETATGLLAAKIQKRLAEREAVGGAPSEISLIPMIDVKQDSVVGEWAVEGGKLICTAPVPFARIQIPYLPPDEYDLTMMVTRTENSESFAIGLVQGSTAFQAAFDSFGGACAGIALLDGKWVRDNETLFGKPLFKNNQPSKIICVVRKDGVKVTVDGRQIVDWKKGYARLSSDGLWAVPNPKALYVGCWGSKYVVSRMILTPVSGRGKRSR